MIVALLLKLRGKTSWKCSPGLLSYVSQAPEQHAALLGTRGIISAGWNQRQHHRSSHPGAAESNRQLFAESSRFGLVSLENPRKAGWGQNLLLLSGRLRQLYDRFEKEKRRIK